MNILALILSLLFLYGCPSSGGGGSPAAPSTAPTISNLRVSPAISTLNSGGSAMTIQCYIDYFDTEGDIDSFTETISKVDALGNPIGTVLTGTQLFNGTLNGKTLGTQDIVAVGDTTYAHTTTFSYYFTDKAGNKSNTLTGTWKVQ